MFAFLNDLPEEVLTWTHRLIAMGIGSVASLLAIGYSPPATYREGVVRFVAGCVSAFSLTGFFVRLFSLSVGIDNVLAVGLACGGIGWGFLGALIKLSESGAITSALSQYIQGRLNNGTKPPTDSNGSK